MIPGFDSTYSPRQTAIGNSGLPNSPVLAQEGVVRWAFPALYITLLYFRNIARVVFSREETEVLLIAVLCASVLVTLCRPNSGRVLCTNFETAWGLLFVAMMCGSAIASGTGTDALIGSSYHVISACLVFLVFSANARSTSGLVAVCAVLSACAALNAGVTLWGAVTHGNIFAGGAADIAGVASFGYDPTNGRSGGLIGENYTGMHNLPAVVGGLVLLSRRRWRFVGSCLILLGVTGTVVSLSRASILAVCGAVCAFVVLVARRANVQVLLGLFGIVSVMCVLGALGYKAYLASLPGPLQQVANQRFSQGGTLKDSRAGLWNIFLEKVAARPLIGSGPGYIEDRSKTGNAVPHNAFLDVAVEFGIPAAIMFTLAMLRPFTTFHATRDSHLACYMYACFAGMLIPLFTLSSPYLPVVWAVAGSVVGASRAQQDSAIAGAEHSIAANGCSTLLSD